MFLAHILADLWIINDRIHFLGLLDVLYMVLDNDLKICFLFVIEHASDQRRLDLWSLGLSSNSGTRNVFVKCRGEVRGMSYEFSNGSPFEQDTPGGN